MIRLCVSSLSLVCFICLCLCSCTVLGPNYEEPDAKWLNEWQPFASQHVAEDVDLRFWWHIFGDENLNGLVQEAQKQNLGLQVAGLRVLEARALLGIAQSAYYPQVQRVTGSGAYINQEESGRNTATGSPNFVSYSVGATVGWEFDFWGRFARGVESADAYYLGSIANQRDVQVILTAQVVDLYYVYQILLQRIAIAQENSNIQKRSFEITKSLYESGQDAELNVQQAKTQYLTTSAAIPILEASLVKTRNALSVLIARPPGNIPWLGSVARLPSVDLKTSKIPANFLLRRPDIRLAAFQIAAQSAQVGIAEADLYPSISLLGSLSFTGNSLNSNNGLTTLSLGPSLTWNVFDYGLIKNAVRVQDARLQQSIENYQNSLLLAAREVEDSIIDVVKTRQRQDILTLSLAAAKRSLELAQLRYREGYADFQRVLDAQRALATQSENQLVNQGNNFSAIIALYKSLGGGWLVQNTTEMVSEERRETMGKRTNWGQLLDDVQPEISEE